jgi:predicted nuclease of predicted toxin-antitoxin system
VKLLLDENLSPRLMDLLSDLYPGSDHVHNLNLGGANDSEVWDYAKLHGFAIVSKDSDFAARSVLV